MKTIYKGIEDKVINIFKDEIKNNRRIIACKVNNEVKSLNYILKDGDNIELIDTLSRDGRRIYIRGLLYVVSKALYEIYPDAYLSIDYQLTNAMYCEVDNMKLTQDMIEKLKVRVKEIIDTDLDIKKVEMSKEEAAKFYETNRTFRGKLQMDNKQKNTVSLYFCEDYYNYFYGVMPLSTGYINLYDILKYHNGFLVRYPSKEKPSIIEEYQESKKLLNTLEEYENIHEVLDINTVQKLNEKIKGDSSKEIILLAEALHEKKIAGIADNIVKKGGIKVVLIAGPSSSGKTTFARRLGIQLGLNGLKPVTISVDNYFVEREYTPLDESGDYDFECLEAIDLELFNNHLTTLLNGGEISVPTFDFKKGTKLYNGEKMKLEENNILVIEGIHCLNDKLTKAIPIQEKYKIYISALTVLNIDHYNRISTTDTRLIRRIVRDNQFRGYKAIHTLQMWNSVNKGEEKHIFPFQEQADSMFNSSLVYELCALKKYAMPLLKQIDSSNEEYSEAKRLYELLKYFEDINDDYVPENSLLREFIGNSIFDV